MPPYHIAGMSEIASSVYSGRRVVQLPDFSAEAWIGEVRRNDISYAFVVPTMLSRIIDALAKEGGTALPSLRALSYGGGKMPLSVIAQPMESHGTRTAAAAATITPHA